MIVFLPKRFCFFEELKIVLIEAPGNNFKKSFNKWKRIPENLMLL
jgi:hypothetical protein